MNETNPTNPTRPIHPNDYRTPVFPPAIITISIFPGPKFFQAQFNQANTPVIQAKLPHFATPSFCQSVSQ
jgi:hypothetical protein